MIWINGILNRQQSQSPLHYVLWVDLSLSPVWQCVRLHVYSVPLASVDLCIFLLPWCYEFPFWRSIVVFRYVLFYISACESCGSQGWAHLWKVFPPLEKPCSHLKRPQIMKEMRQSRGSTCSKFGQWTIKTSITFLKFHLFYQYRSYWWSQGISPRLNISPCPTTELIQV